MQASDYCHEIEAYLCRKNDGHLIRVVGPSFDLVSGWAAQGVPIKIAFEGIDRYFERYYRRGPRRRPVKIDFCEADVLDAFDEWRRATGVVGVSHQQSAGGDEPSADADQPSAIGHQPSARRRSLPEHLERAVMRLSSARASGALDGRFDAVIDRIAAELEAARGKAGGVRGEARTALIGRLEAIDRDMLGAVRAAAGEDLLAQTSREADEELAPFRAGMTAQAYARAHEAAVGRLLRGRLNLPTIAFD